MRPEVSPQELYLRCEMLKAELALRVERERVGVAANENTKPAPSFWWDNDA